MPSAPTDDGGSIVLSLRRSKYLKLDKTATEIFGLLRQYGSVELATGALAKKYGLDLHDAMGDVRHVSDKLLSERLAPKEHLRPPAPKLVLSGLKSWWAMPSSKKAGVLKCSVILGLIEGGLKFLSLGTLCGTLGIRFGDFTEALSRAGDVKPGGREPSPDNDSDSDSAKEPSTLKLSDREKVDVYCAKWVLGRWVMPDTCLREALLVGFVLRRHSPALKIDLIGEGPETHAWLLVEGSEYNRLSSGSPFSASV